VPVEIEGPLGRALASTEPLLGIPRERFHHVGVDTAMPRQELARSPSPPASVDEAVDLVHVEAAHFRQPPLAPEYSGAVLSFQ